MAMNQEQKVIRSKVGVLELAKQLGNVSQACRVMGYSREAHDEFESECPGYAVRRIRSTAARSRASGASNSRLSSIPTPSWPSPNSTIARTPLGGGRPAQRPRDPVLRRARDPVAAGADRPRHGVLRRARAPRVRAVPGGGEHRSHPNQGEESQTNGIVERFHRTVLNEFYRVAFRRKIYASIEQLQADLDGCLKEYNELRPHQGRWCYGKTPLQTFFDSLPLAREKILSPAVAGGAEAGAITQ
jgi:hypothetical protein